MANPTVTDEELISVMAGAFGSGGVSAQVPDQMMWFGPKSGMDQATAQKHADLMDRAIDRGISDGVLAWRVANPNPMTRKVLYTAHARNPATGRLVSAYPWMTPLAIVQHGAGLYQAYVKAVAEREKNSPRGLVAVPEREFQQTLLHQTVPVAPALASQVPADILAMVSPPPAKKVKPKIAADGFIDALGPRQANSLGYYRLRDGALLDQLDKWKVGPNTTLPNDANSQETIIQMVLSSAGPQGVDWLVAHKFPLSTSTYRQALLGRAAISTLDALEKAGVDPAVVTPHGNLWNFISASRNWDEDVVAWARKRNISWKEVDAQGDLPLASLLHKICHEAGVADFFSPTQPGLPGAMAGLTAMMLGALAGATNDTAARFKFLEDLALEMVRSGVDLMHQNKQGLSTAGNIFPEQSSAQRRLFELTDPTLPPGEREREAMQEMMFGDRNKLKRDPMAYGPRALAFIRNIEQISGHSLLDTPVAPLAKPPRP